MGNSVSTLCEALGSSKHEQDQAERLNFLQKMGKLRAESARDKLLRATKKDLKLRRGTIVEEHTGVNITVYRRSTPPSGQATGEDSESSRGHNKEQDIDGLRGCIRKFFHGDLVDGIQSVISVSLDSFLGNTIAREVEKQDYFLVWADSALLRIDWYCYRYNMPNRDVIQDVQSLFVYTLVKRIMDWRSLDPQLVTHAINRYCHKDSERITQEIQHVASLMKSKTIDNQSVMHDKMATSASLLEHDVGMKDEHKLHSPSSSCPMCVLVIDKAGADEEDQEAILCKGECGHVFQRWSICAAKEQNKTLKNGKEEVLCPCCEVRLHDHAILELRQQVSTLLSQVNEAKSEVAMLRKTLARPESPTQRYPIRWSPLMLERVQKRRRSSRPKKKASAAKKKALAAKKKASA